MRFLSRLLLHSPLKSTAAATPLPSTFRLFSSAAGGGGDDFWNDATPSNWTMGLTKEHFDGEAVGRKIDTPEEPPSQPSRPQQPPPQPQQSPSQPRPKAGPTATTQFANAQWTEKEIDLMREIEAANKKGKAFVDGWGERLKEMSVLLKQVREPGARGSYLKDSEKAEMYKLHKENPEVYTVEKLAKDYRIMRQRVHAILWLKQDEEEMEKKLGYPLDDSVELLLDTCPEFFASNDREFHVASLPYKPDFKIMPEGWDGTTRDPDEVHYEISMKEDEMLYQEFVQRMNFNKMKMAKQIKCHKYSRRRPNDGWNFTIEKMGPRGKRGNGGGWKFVSLADGSSRPLNELEKMFVKRETPRRRRKLIEKD